MSYFSLSKAALLITLYCRSCRTSVMAFSPRCSFPTCIEQKIEHQCQLNIIYCKMTRDIHLTLPLKRLSMFTLLIPCLFTQRDWGFLDLSWPPIYRVDTCTNKAMMRMPFFLPMASSTLLNNVEFQWIRWSCERYLLLIEGSAINWTLKSTYSYKVCNNYEGDYLMAVPCPVIRLVWLAIVPTT